MRSYRFLGVYGVFIALKSLDRKQKREDAMKLYEALDWKQKEMINIMAITQMKLRNINDRDDPLELIEDVKIRKVVSKYYDEQLEEIHWNKVLTELDKMDIKKEPEVVGVEIFLGFKILREAVGRYGNHYRYRCGTFIAPTKKAVKKEIEQFVDKAKELGHTLKIDVQPLMVCEVCQEIECDDDCPNHIKNVIQG